MLGMVQESVSAKCDLVFPLERGDDELVARLGLQEIHSSFVSSRNCRHGKKRVQRVGRWLLPPNGFLKINTDGSSRGNPGPAGIGGVGRDSAGSVIFLFSIHEGVKTVNFMEGLAILHAIERALALGWRKVICEADSQILINLLNERKISDINWQLASVVQRILQVSSRLEEASFVHIPREWNRVVNCLAKWASEHDSGWKVEDWDQVNPELHLDLDRFLEEDRRIHEDS